MSGYDLRTPCRNCPFRADIEPYLRRDRAAEIADSLERGAEFPCHKTVDYSRADDNDDEGHTTERSQLCAGALATMERSGFANQMMRIAERLGMYDASKLDADAPVFATLDEWVAHHA